jgi:hypothetical protein
VDFVVLDMDLDKETSLNLGCPFLSTTEAIIDVGARNIHGIEEKFEFRPGAEQCSMVKIMNGPNPQNIQEVELKPPKIDNLIAFTKNFLENEAFMSTPHPKKTTAKPGAQAKQPIKPVPKKPPTTPKTKKVCRVKQTTSAPSPSESSGKSS